MVLSQTDRQAISQLVQRTEEAVFTTAFLRSRVKEIKKDVLTSRDAHQLKEEIAQLRVEVRKIGELRPEMQRMSGRVQLLEELEIRSHSSR